MSKLIVRSIEYFIDFTDFTDWNTFYDYKNNIVFGLKLLKRDP